MTEGKMPPADETVLEKARTFGRRLIVDVVKNLVVKTVLWGIVFAFIGFIYGKMIFSGESMPEAFGTLGTLASFAIYFAAGIVAGLCFGVLASARSASLHITDIINTGVSMTFVKFLPEDKDTISVEELGRILDSVAPPEGGLSAWPLRLVRKKVQSDLLSRASAEGSSSLEVEKVKAYITERLAAAAVSDLRTKAFLVRVIAWMVVSVFIFLPLLFALAF